MTPAEFIDNPDWASFLPCSSDARPRAAVAHEDCSPLDVESVKNHLRCGGTLGSMPGYEERSAQLRMTEAVAEVFNTRRHLMVESGTGTGKSLAYLVPCVQWAWLNDTPVVVSTATRNLQSQLVGSDIPKALKTLGVSQDRFKVALLKGRGNYLCLRAVDDFFSGGYWTMASEDQALMPMFIKWLQTTDDGDLDSYEGLPKDIVSCPGEECAGRSCRFYQRCFVYKARKRAAAAHLVVVNHALTLTEASNPDVPLLPAYARIVMDEAHNLENTATEFLSKVFSEVELSRIARRLSGGRRHGRKKSGGILDAIARQLARGGVAERSDANAVVSLVSKVTLSLAPLQLSAAGISAAARFIFADEKSDGPVRFRAGILAECTMLAEAHAKFENAAASTVNLLHGLCEALARAAGANVRLLECSRTIANIADSIVSFANDTAFILAADRPDTHVYWAERIKPPKRKPYLSLAASPISVGDDLRNLLFSQKDSAVLCSATLRTGGSFAYMMQRLGFHDEEPSEAGRYTTLAVDSPFDYFRQSLVLAPDFMCDPTDDIPRYVSELAGLVSAAVRKTGGRCLVLFTSREMMLLAAGSLRASLEGSGIELLVQGEGLSRELMTRRLKSNPESTVIFGMQSFWEGVDVAGEALVLVVMARLPFAQRTDPVIEARGEKVEREGGNAFRHYTLPEAAIRFRQGFGRLIRTKTDRGIVIVADPRIVTKNYGSVFRKSIPATVRTVSSIDDLMDAMDDFLV